LRGDLLCDFPGPLDIACLAGFVAAAHNQHNRLACLLVVDALAGTVTQAHFADALADRLDVSCVTKAKSLNSRCDLRNGPLVRERGPIVEFIGL
jgi:hypothetical protein